MDPGGDQTRNVGHIDEKVSARLTGDVGKDVEPDLARVGRGSGDDHLRPVLLRERADLVVVDIAVCIKPIGNHVVMLARKIDGRAVGQVSAVGQAHAQHGVSGFAEGEIDRLVGLRTRVGLNIGMLGAEQLAGAAAGDLLDDVNTLASAVVTFAGIALGIFVGEHRAHRGKHRRGDDIFARNQFDVPALAGQLPFHRRAHLRVAAGDKSDRVKHVLVHKTLSPFVHSWYTSYGISRDRRTCPGKSCPLV